VDHSLRGLAERSLHADEAVLVALLVAIAVGFGFALRHAHVVDLAWSVVLVVLAAAWLALDAPFEGRTLWTVTATHGLTTGDLQAVPALVEALGLVGRFVLHRRRGGQR
jgi:hypothetical protein